MRCRPLFLLILLAFFGSPQPVGAGMPAALPTRWTAESTPAWTTRPAAPRSAPARWQAISFFLMVLTLSAFLVKRVWNDLARDIQKLPYLSTGSAFRATILCGLAFILVLTMISGARELMTPGAWKKQGWTYQLAGTGAPGPADHRAERRTAFDNLRTAAWQYAALHSGRLPTVRELGAAAELPGLPGVNYVIAESESAAEMPRLYAYEPALVDAPQFVLMSDGRVMETDIVSLLASVARRHPPVTITESSEPEKERD